MVLLPCPPTPTEVKRNDVEKVTGDDWGLDIETFLDSLPWQF